MVKNSYIFWNMAPFRPFKDNRYFGGICRHHVQGGRITWTRNGLECWCQQKQSDQRQRHVTTDGQAVSLSVEFLLGLLTRLHLRICRCGVLPSDKRLGLSIVCHHKRNESSICVLLSPSILQQFYDFNTWWNTVYRIYKACASPSFEQAIKLTSSSSLYNGFLVTRKIVSLTATHSKPLIFSSLHVETSGHVGSGIEIENSKSVPIGSSAGQNEPSVPIGYHIQPSEPIGNKRRIIGTAFKVAVLLA
jgi:hypothetical protein